MAIDVETARVLAVGGSTLAVVLGSGLTVSVAFAATVPVHEPIKATLVRVGVWCRKALSGLLRLVYVVTGAKLAYGVAVTYLHVGWRKQKHAYVTRGRHRPDVIAANPWRPVLRWMPDGYTPYVEWMLSGQTVNSDI